MGESGDGRPYRRSAAVYDAIYRSGAEGRGRMADEVHRLIQAHKRSPGRRLLDVACGTGWYLPRWRQAGYEVEGVDLSPEMLALAGKREPGVPLHLGDMATFELGERFDAVVCLGSSIGYTRTSEGLDRALANFARHTVPGGVVVVHGWVRPDRWRGDGLTAELTAELTDEPDLKVARLSRSWREGDVSVLEMHHLVVTRNGGESYVERHEMGLFTPERYRAAFEWAGLDAIDHDSEAGGERGLYLGVKS
jgi:SAM-dependent methyltransferase